MNSLSWMIYLADILGSLKIFTGFIAGGLGISGIICLIASLDCNDKDGVKFSVKMLSGMVAVVFLSCIIPGEKTMMRITASEMAERVITNPQVQNIVDPSITYLRLWLGKQIKELEGSNK